MPEPRQRGSIAPHRNGWLIRPHVPPHPLSGVRRQFSRVVHGDYKDAQKALTAWQAELDAGAIVDPSRITVAQLCERWLEDEARHNVRPTTLDGYQATIATHILPRIGSKRAQLLVPADVAAFRSALLRERSVRSAQLALLRLKQALSWGVSVELLKRNVATEVKPPRDTTEERRALSHAEARAFLEIAATDALAPLWHLYLATGLRRGEGLGLRWRDMDLVGNTLSVRQAVVLTDKPSRPTIVEPKSPAAKRTLVIDGNLVMALREHQITQVNRRKSARLWSNLDLVFATRHGTPLNPNNVLRSFKLLREAAGIDPSFRLHDLRHTHATHLLLAGVPITVVSKRLGHTRTSITMDTYSHLLPGQGGLALGAIEAALYGAVPELGG